MILGVVGKVGSGKSTCIKYIKENYAAIVFSSDEVANEIIKNEKYDFGFSTEIFTNENKQEFLRKNFHPEVFCKIKEDIYNFNNINNCREQLFIIESALPSDDMYDICDKILLVESKKDNKINWLEKSRNYTKEKTIQILNSQNYYEKFYNKADYKILNDGSLTDLERKTKEVIDEIYIACK